MSEIVAGLIGVIAGGLVTGAIQLFQAWQDRRLATKIAARLILIDLYEAANYVETALKGGRWAHHPDTFERPVADWRAQREAFAATAAVGDWVVVSAAFTVIADIGERIKPGEELSADDRKWLRHATAPIQIAADIAEARTGELENRDMKEIETRLDELQADDTD
jgi:hypothetical protein